MTIKIKRTQKPTNQHFKAFDKAVLIKNEMKLYINNLKINLSDPRISNFFANFLNFFKIPPQSVNLWGVLKLKKFKDFGIFLKFIAFLIKFSEF